MERERLAWAEVSRSSGVPQEVAVSPTRIFLLVTGLSSVGIGVAYLVAPTALAALTDLHAQSPLAVVEVRGFYGGQLVGLGVLILLGASRSAFVAPALLLIAASLGGTAFGRVVGLVVSGTLPPIMLGLLGAELLATAAALILWSRGRRLDR
jgi:hypothetical protein